MVLVIGMIGRKQTGKDTFADYLLRRYPGKRMCKYSMATPLKDACQQLFQLRPEQLHDEREKETADPRWGGRTPRQLFQWLGTDVFREQFDQDFWIRHAVYRVKKLASTYDVVIIPDIRFKNEAAFVRSFPEHILVRIHRPGPCVDSHPSESETEDVPLSWLDATIRNDGSLSDYHDKIDAVVGNRLV